MKILFTILYSNPFSNTLHLLDQIQQVLALAIEVIYQSNPYNCL